MKPPKNAVIVESPLSLPVVAVSPEVVEQVSALSQKASEIKRIEDRVGFAYADQVCGDIRKLGRELEKQRTEVKAPILELGRAVDAASKEVAQLLKEAGDRLGREVLRYQRVEREKAEKAERERRAREAELQREADARATEEAEIADLFEDSAPAPAPAPRVDLVAPKSAAPPKAKSVSTRKVPKLVIFDGSLIPRAYLVPDQVQIKQALQSGIEVPGCRIESEETVVSKG